MNKAKIIFINHPNKLGNNSNKGVMENKIYIPNTTAEELKKSCFSREHLVMGNSNLIYSKNTSMKNIVSINTFIPRRFSLCTSGEINRHTQKILIVATYYPVSKTYFKAIN